MSIEVSRLSKTFHRRFRFGGEVGTQQAVSDISFTVREGEIAGFLGPNGAGKSTTMKMITGYLPPTAGTVLVNGKNIAKEPRSAKQSIGYLGEHNPLYLDMYVHEYLAFAAGLYGLSSTARRKRVKEMLSLCGLEPEQNKKIGQLSKGYRQRIGLAQSLIHDPPVLVLDEPTSGLDPNQLVEMRKLIKSVSARKTVLFSSHILQEVEALCERVIVIHHGVIVADDRLANMVRGRTEAVVIEFSASVSEGILSAAEGVQSVSVAGPNRYRLVARPGFDIRVSLIRLAAERRLPMVGMVQEENSLESVFSQLTTEASS